MGSSQDSNREQQDAKCAACVVCGNCFASLPQNAAKNEKRCTFEEIDEGSTGRSESETSCMPPSTKYSIRDNSECTISTQFTEQLNRPSDESMPKRKKCKTTSCGTNTTNATSICVPNGRLHETTCPDFIPFDKEVMLSGMYPQITAGPYGYDCCTVYAPCGHWSTCTDENCPRKKLFQTCDTCGTRAPFGPYGPWNKFGPSKFTTPYEHVIKRQFPKKSSYERKTHPMGKIRAWPLAGSCRYAGRPYGPCRPFGAYRSRGPFGSWEMMQYEVEWIEKPTTPCQPCWKPKKRGCRPCTPCHRPLYRPCPKSCKERKCYMGIKQLCGQLGGN